MIVHLRQILPDGLHIQGEEPVAALDLPPGEILSAEPLRYELDLGLSGDGLFATGHLAMEVELMCVSCLRPFRRLLEVPGFALQTELTGPETVDLTPFLREDTLLALPAHPRCDWDGSRKCPGPPVSHVTMGQEGDSAQATWAALDELNLSDKKPKRE